MFATINTLGIITSTGTWDQCNAKAQGTTDRVATVGYGKFVGESVDLGY